VCGIAGFTHRRTRPEPEVIRNATMTLRHRGPDQQGVWEDEAVSLGAVRLKIQDLTGGDQPIVSPDGQAVIVFNGEVYNHLEMRAELEQRGHRFLSHCDTETVLAAFREWGVASFKRLRGMFAFAVWMPLERRLMLVRDRLGIKPLYIREEGGEVWFSSELKAMFAMPGVSRRLDRQGLAVYLTRNYPAPDRTLIEGIGKLPPGAWLEWRDGVVTRGEYWRIPEDVKPWTLDDARGELDRLLRSSIREHLLSDVPLGVWASGGLDSTTVLHYAAAEVPRLKTFSVSFAGRSFDESRWFREAARHYGTDHHEFDLHPQQEIAATVEALPYFTDEPSADAGAVPVFFLSRMCRAQVTVALSGEGADELFGGYKTYQANAYARIARAVPRPFTQGAVALARLLPPSNEKIGFDYKLQRFLEGVLLPPEEAHFFWNGTFRNGELMPRFSISSDSNFLITDQRHYLPEDILHKCDRMSMAHSLEVRPPFLDHRLVEFANSLPMNLKIRGGSLKFVLRDLMRDKLPASILKRPKEGFDIPVQEWFRTILRPLLMDTLASAPPLPFDLGVVRRLADDHVQRRRNAGYHLWGVLILLLWMKRWNVVTS
jgi:asparagine synthase (glutamine-hydrolysing)